MILLLLIWLVPGALIGAAGGKGHGWAGFVLGLLLGPVGWLIVACMGPSRRVRMERESAHAAEVVAAIHAHDLASGVVAYTDAELAG